jgi:hypothetical protein
MGCPCTGGRANPQVASARFSDKTFIAPGETIECYMARSGDGGDPDGSGMDVLDKIKTTDIQVKCDLSVDTTFTLTEHSLDQSINPATSLPWDEHWKDPVHWAILVKDSEGNVVDLSTIGLTFDSDSGKLSGTLPDDAEGQDFDVFISVTAAHIDNSDAIETLDERAYKLVGKKCDNEDLSFINPLPGSVITSEYSLSRTITINGETVTKPHKGIDLAYTGGKVGDVVAAADGVIAYAGWLTGYGNLVILKHVDSSGNIMATTRYAHLETIYIAEGSVGAGTPIGREGNTGHSSGNHLHFELRIGGAGTGAKSDGTPVDPKPYLFGSVSVASGGDASNPSGSTTTQINNGSVKLTTATVKAKGKCADSVAIGTDPTYRGQKSPDVQTKHKSRCRPTPDTTPDKDQVKAQISAALDRHPELDAEDKAYFLHLTKIESGYDPYAWAGSTSALGPYQMVDGTAQEYYQKAGIPLTCENRCDPDKATEAMIIMYKEQKKIYDGYKATGKILGKSPPLNEHTARYSTMPKEQFIYLLHHDGAGSAQRGNNLQGADYWATHSPA